MYYVCTSVCVCRYRWDDGVLEVMAVTSAFHMASLQVGLSSPIRLGQASTVKVKNCVTFVSAKRTPSAHSISTGCLVC